MFSNNFIEVIKFPFRSEKELRKKLRKILGFYPNHIEYYKLALLHKSALKRSQTGKRLNNERLEFLGDAILDAIVGDIVYRHFPGKSEGFLTNTRSKLVKRETLGKLAKEIGLDKLITSKSQHVAHNSYMEGNAFEALVGAIYLDKGYSACMQFMNKRILAQMINIDKIAHKETNFKSKLLEWSQKNRINIEFRLIDENTDNDSSPVFKHEVVFEGKIKGAIGTGYSKKESQQMAARGTLQMLKRDVKMLDSVFAAKADRTKMEEMPVESVPDIPEIRQPKAQQQPRRKKQQDKVKPQPDSDKQSDEFDLSGITARRQTNEEVIAAAEKAAWGEA